MQSNDSKNIFIFKSHRWDSQKNLATFNYQHRRENEVFDFSETLAFPTSDQKENIPKDLLKSILDSLLLILGISYYKLFCPKELVLENIDLTKAQAEFWNTVYTKGLGEFFYKNQIDFRGLISFPYSAAVSSSHVEFPRKNRSLLGIGGGKDSIVAGEIIKKLGKSFSAFVVNIHPIMEKSINLLGVDSIAVRREIDPLLIQLNKREDTYNGHVPVSAQNAFIGLLTAIIFDYKYIVMANEQSANYGSTNYLGQEINHQWSKSYEFEALFKEYVKSNITSDIYYFSIIRAFSEISIAEKFSKNSQYFSVFSSCNKNFSIKEKSEKMWCCECPKCAFTFAMISAFLPKSQMIEIFGQNLFEKNELLQVYKELLGVSEIKPLDCVGTPEEVKIAFYLAMNGHEYEDTVAMKFFQKDVLPNISNIEQLREEVFLHSEKNNIPEEFKESLKL